MPEEGESEESDGGGEKEEASNNRDGESSPMASINPLPMSKMQALRTIHCNLADYVIEELGKVDGSSPETWNFPSINQALSTEKLKLKSNCTDLMKKINLKCNCKPLMSSW